MNDSDLADVRRVTRILEGYEKPWAICGGWAIDLYLNDVTRPHKDVDIALLRRDQLVMQQHLLTRGWTLEKAIHGQFVAWQPGEWIDLPVHIIWCKNPQASPDFVELLFNEIDESNFLFRRDMSITLPIEKMITSSASGVPILAPEIVLLYKSAKPDDSAAAADFKNASPKLSLERRDWLATALRKLYVQHIWLEDLS